MTLSREELLKQTAADIVEITPEGWDTPIRVRQLRQGEYKKIYATIDEKDPFGTMPPLIIASLMDEDDEPMFKKGDAALIQDMAAAKIVSLVAAINEVNGFNQEQEEKNS